MHVTKEAIEHFSTFITGVYIVQVSLLGFVTYKESVSFFQK